jgi:hypothetical protein
VRYGSASFPAAAASNRPDFNIPQHPVPVGGSLVPAGTRSYPRDTRHCGTVPTVYLRRSFNANSRSPVQRGVRAA